MDPVVYRRRRSRLSRTECEWRVDDKALTSRGGSINERRVRWGDIVSVRLYRESAPGRPFRYVFELKPHDRTKIILDNAHYLEPGCYEDRSDTYVPFVHAALARIAAESPKARALMGETQKRYFFLLLLALVSFCALALALILIPTPLDALPYANLGKFVVIALMIPVFGRWVLGAMPRGLPLDAIPERLLPPIAPERDKTPPN